MVFKSFVILAILLLSATPALCSDSKDEIISTQKKHIAVLQKALNDTVVFSTWCAGELTDAQKRLEQCYAMPKDGALHQGEVLLNERAFFKQD